MRIRLGDHFRISFGVLDAGWFDSGYSSCVSPGGFGRIHTYPRQSPELC